MNEAILAGQNLNKGAHSHQPRNLALVLLADHYLSGDILDHVRGFIAGGVIHAPAFGILLGTLGLSGLRTGELPRPVVVTALASASASLLAPLYLVAEPMAWFIPAGRFPGLVATSVAGAQLARGARPDR